MNVVQLIPKRLQQGERNERYKYTDLSLLANANYVRAIKSTDENIAMHANNYRMQQADSILLVMVNGYFEPEYSDLDKLPEGVIASSLMSATISHAELVKKYLSREISATAYPFANLNASMFQDGLFLFVPANVEVSAPIHILSLTTGDQPSVAYPHNLFVVGDNAKVVLLRESVSGALSGYMTNSVDIGIIGKGAKMEWNKYQHESTDAILMSHTFLYQQSDSQVTYTNFSSGCKFARDDLIVRLQESGAECRSAGFYKCQNDNQYVDNHVEIIHMAPRSKSEMLYKGTVDKKSRAVFNGRLLVEKDAQKITAYQANHNILLSNQAEIYSKPELEIYADDVKCKHGATTGQIDHDALFYMRSRGIEKTVAMNILLQGFADDIMQRITNMNIRKHIKKMVSVE